MSMSVREAGRKGGETTKARHGIEHYERIGEKGGQRLRELIDAGKRAKADAVHESTEEPR